MILRSRAWCHVCARLSASTGRPYKLVVRICGLVQNDCLRVNGRVVCERCSRQVRACGSCRKWLWPEGLVMLELLFQHLSVPRVCVQLV